MAIMTFEKTGGDTTAADGEACAGDTSAAPEGRYRALIDASLGIVWRAAPDLSVLEAWGWSATTGQTKAEYIGDGWLDAVHPDDRAEIVGILDGGRRHGQPCEGTYRARQADGGYRWVHARVVPLRDRTGAIREWVGNLVDVHDKLESHAAIRTAEERLRLALENSAVGVWDHDFDAQTGWWSEAKRAVLGLPEDYPITQDSFLALVHPEDRPEVDAKLARAKRADSGGRFEAEFRVRRFGDDAEVWIASRGQVFFKDSGAPRRIVGTMRDITAQRAAQRELYQLAHFDQLTGLANRLHFIECVEQAIPKVAAGAVILLDLDGFKDVNDTAGHHAGDLLLRAVSDRLAAGLPPGALAARWGGDEFALFIPDEAGSLALEQMLATIESAFAKPFALLQRDVFLGVSLGIAVAPTHGGSAQELVINADLALYQAKADGHSVNRIFSPALKKEVQDRVDLHADLRRAFASREFEMHYQPQVDMRTGAIVGAEALLRWRHPSRGLLFPGQFLPVLKSSAIVPALGGWILATSCAAASAWQRAGRAIRVSVNVFSAQFRAGGLLETVRRSLDASGLPPELLELEITEKTILNRVSNLTEMLGDLRKLGVGIAFDDYGTGYASLSMLTDYPLTRLKIDKKFVDRISVPGNEALVRAIVSLGHAFGLQVTAEGIESEAQAEMVRALGCDEGQGYLYGRALPEEDLRTLLGLALPMPAGRARMRA